MRHQIHGLGETGSGLEGPFRLLSVAVWPVHLRRIPRRVVLQEDPLYCIVNLLKSQGIPSQDQSRLGLLNVVLHLAHLELVLPQPVRQTLTLQQRQYARYTGVRDAENGDRGRVQFGERSECCERCADHDLGPERQVHEGIGEVELSTALELVRDDLFVQAPSADPCGLHVPVLVDADVDTYGLAELPEVHVLAGVRAGVEKRGVLVRHGCDGSIGVEGLDGSLMSYLSIHEIVRRGVVRLLPAPLAAGHGAAATPVPIGEADKAARLAGSGLEI